LKKLRSITKSEHRLVKCLLDGFQRLLTGLLFFGALLFVD